MVNKTNAPDLQKKVIFSQIKKTEKFCVVDKLPLYFYKLSLYRLQTAYAVYKSDYAVCNACVLIIILTNCITHL